MTGRRRKAPAGPHVGPAADHASAAKARPRKPRTSPRSSYPQPYPVEPAICPRRGCDRLACAPCPACADFLAACTYFARGTGPVYGGRVLLELVQQAARAIASGRTAEGHRTLRSILQAAGMEPTDTPGRGAA